MERARTPEGHPFCLASGTVVGDWRVEGCRGHGAYGVVYRAVRVGQEEAGPVAIKVALFPWDPRFMREVALLSLIRHPSVPRLLGQGFWRHPGGTVHPFVAMEWVEGTPLYDWAREHTPSSEEMSRVLAQLMRALEATHTASAVHRDVKGDNVLVRGSDGRAILTDYGAGSYQAAARLTWEPGPPGTPAYRSPEAGLFLIRSVRSPGAHYVARPADDIYALGVTAYRLVTGQYPQVAEPQMDERGVWYMEEAHPQPLHVLNPRVDPRLGALILRMLSLAPEARGTASELAAELESLAEHAGSEMEPPRSVEEPPRILQRPEVGPVAVDEPAVVPPVPTRHRAEAAPLGVDEPAVVPPVPARPMSWGRVLARVSFSALALAGVFLAVWTYRALRMSPAPWGSTVPVASVTETPDAGTALAEAAPVTPPASAHEPSEEEAVGDTPPDPFPGQSRPDERGRCPGREQVLINGVCWVEQSGKDGEACEQNGYVFLKQKCYAPAFGQPRKRRPPTSNPVDAR
ncbi:serine/threonine protein kinase [Hyalangium versicolor]|uniref:serine/threonine protein kinase n=1 Tax=Hyalangium versicolor TaxID=2861190 RepID=UPI001CCBF6C8|nr:serine/threonine-protein kinase [Hyalangium versicolor]